MERFWNCVLAMGLMLAASAASGAERPREKVLSEIEGMRDDMVAALTQICTHPAVSPHAGGTGEEEKAREIEKIVSGLGLGSVVWERVSDDKSPTGKRPSLFLTWPGRQKRRLCILSHTDIVSEGDRSLWSLDPFKPEVRGTKLYGRGVTDDGVAIVSSLYALKALKDAGVTPEFTICLVFAADEEEGSEFGLSALLERGLFREDDLVLVPDGGNPAGDFIEIAEKGAWQPTFIVTGKQVHGSTPEMGLNACRVANLFSIELDKALHEAFPETDARFDPPSSTFEPTRRFQNVASVNIIPGKEVLNFDCRILPSVPMEKVDEVARRVMRDVEARTGAKIEMEVTPERAPQPTAEDSEIVKLLSGAVRSVLNVEPRAGGIGGGTFASLFRARGIPAAVWLQCDSSQDHQPDECVEIATLVNNAKVFALMMMGGAEQARRP